MFLPTLDLLEELNKDEEAPWKDNKGGKTELSPHGSRLAEKIRREIRPSQATRQIGFYAKPARLLVGRSRKSD